MRVSMGVPSACGDLAKHSEHVRISVSRAYKGQIGLGAAPGRQFACTDGILPRGLINALYHSNSSLVCIRS